MSIIEQIKAEIERLENYYTSVERHIEALISFLDTLKSEKPKEQEKEFKPCHRTREKLAEWSKTQEGRESYEKVAEEMRKQIVPNDLEEAAKKHSCYDEDCEGVWYEPIVRNAFIAGAKWQKQQMMKEAENPCHTVEEWMEHIKNADALTKAIFSKGPYNVLYDALNRPYRDCYDAIKEFGELCYQTARQDMMKEAVPFYEILEAVPPGPERENVRIIIVKED